MMEREVFIMISVILIQSNAMVMENQEVGDEEQTEMTDDYSHSNVTVDGFSHSNSTHHHHGHGVALALFRFQDFGRIIVFLLMLMLAAFIKVIKVQYCNFNRTVINRGE